ncbi:FxDxF family PEP-CTERM protein [Burkholderiaceae bacterium UC74_6]
MFRKTLIAAALMASCVAASADSFDWGTHAATEAGQRNVAAGSFADYYEFSLLNPMTIAGAAVSVNLTLGNTAAYQINNGLLSLWQDNGTLGSDGSDTLLGAWSYNGTSGDLSHVLDLTGGNYYYMVTGVATGAAGGLYSVASTITSPVPEPESYALMLAGLGVIGFIAGRRRR